MADNKEVMSAVQGYFNNRPKLFYRAVLQWLKSKWHKYITNCCMNYFSGRQRDVWDLRRSFDSFTARKSHEFDKLIIEITNFSSLECII